MAAKRKKGTEESLTTALARLLGKTILPDLTARAKTPAVAAVLAEQHARERAQERTADTLAEWMPRWLEQIGAAWVLSCVFLRTLEDRGLIRHRRIAGEGAADSEQLFFEIAPSLTARDYLLTVFREVAHYPGADDLLGPARNFAFRLSPSNEGARALLDFFCQRDETGKSLRWRFEGTDTRFLGDLYQDLSESVRERFALLQTPVFVEEFILDLTLEPAIATFGLGIMGTCRPQPRRRRSPQALAVAACPSTYSRGRAPARAVLTCTSSGARLRPRSVGSATRSAGAARQSR